MMKPAVLLLAFAALAVSLPSDIPETFVEVATAELTLPPAADVMDVVSPKVSLVQVTAADHEQARAKVTALLQQGNDQSACSQMAQNALDEVTAAVKAQQDALDEMDKGANCDGAGDQHKEDAKTAKENAATTLQQAKETLAAAQSTTVDLGSYKWSQLNPQSCASLFEIEGYTAVTKAVNDAQSAVNAAQGVLDDATQHVEDAVQKAADMVTECKCKVMEEQAAALEKMNKDAKEANTKTWNQAKLMQCVLDGTSESNCDLGTIPVVTETELADGVSDTFCSGLPFKAKLGARNGVPPREYTFRLAQVNPSNNYGDDFRTVSKEECRKIGMLPVCDHPSYCKDDANAIYLGQDHHISHGSHMQNNGYFPDGWNEIKKEFYGTCMYSFNANGANSLCNNDASGNGNGFLEAGGNPWGSHAWLRPSQTQGNGKDGKPNRARFFMCAKINHRTFEVDLGAKNGVPARTVAFKMITAMDKATGEIDRNMIKDCNAVGMKPVCDHPNYCKDNADGFYVGQDHHFAHSPHRRTVSYYPSGWQTFVNDYYPETRGICAFTAEHNGWASTLCNGYSDSHEWATSAKYHEFMCAKEVAAPTPAPTPAAVLRGPVFEHLAELSLDGSTCALRSEVDQSALPIGQTPYTLEAEIKTSSSASQGIISWGNFGSHLQVNAFRTAGASTLVNYWWSADISKSTGGVNLADGSWHHVMATFDGTTRKLYVDGTEIGSDTRTGLAVTKTDNFCVGSSNNGEYFTGQMRNIKVWNLVQPEGGPEATVYLLVPGGSSSGHSNTASEQPNAVDPEAGWTDTGETYTEKNSIPRRLWTKTITTEHQLYHATTPGWGWVYMVKPASGVIMHVQKSSGKAGCGPVEGPDATTTSDVNCDRGYKFGSGFAGFFSKYGQDLTVLKDAHDPNDISWPDTKFAKVTLTHPTHKELHI